MKTPQGVSKTEDAVKSEPLTRKGHTDTLHYVGDGLPAPSLIKPILPTGVGNVGVSPIMAREDHIHGASVLHSTALFGEMTGLAESTNVQLDLSNGDLDGGNILNGNMPDWRSGDDLLVPFTATYVFGMWVAVSTTLAQPWRIITQINKITSGTFVAGDQQGTSFSTAAARVTSVGSGFFEAGNSLNNKARFIFQWASSGAETTADITWGVWGFLLNPLVDGQ